MFVLASALFASIVDDPDEGNERDRLLDLVARLAPEDGLPPAGVVLEEAKRELESAGPLPVVFDPRSADRPANGARALGLRPNEAGSPHGSTRDFYLGKSVNHGFLGPALLSTGKVRVACSKLDLAEMTTGDMTQDGLVRASPVMNRMAHPASDSHTTMRTGVGRNPLAGL